ncbi:MAG TPA: hypothetical protein VLE71_04655 [Actinomycetota bacterium]|nr:hypothetical protein [Actinomycetota bacterium]
MFQNKDGDLPESDAVAPEERAYEDNWYRSLKALADQRQDQDDATDDMETPADDPVDVAPAEPVARADEPETAEGASTDGPGAADRERLVSQEFETRAGQLLERLRSIQHLSER